MTTSGRFLLLADPQVGMTAAFSAMPAHVRAKVEGLFQRAGMLPEGGRLRVRQADAGPVGLETDVQQVAQAIDAALTLRPDFVVVCGDLVNNIDQPEQADALEREFARLPDDIPLFCVPGNHDLSVSFHHPNADGLSEYRRRFGADFQSFDFNGTFFLALNSETLHEPGALPDETVKQYEFIGDALTSQSAREVNRIIAFMHTPLHTGHRVLDAGNNIIATGYREKLLALFQQAGVEHVFSGHLHQNRHATSHGIRFTTSGAIGMPVVGQPGYRLVSYTGETITQRFIPVSQ